MNIGFTGHRDRLCTAESLDKIAAQFPLARWIHGGAEGFDTQVQRYAVEHGIKTMVIRPDYRSLPYKVAPLVRNRRIVDVSDFVVACYDGRKTGGTAYTIKYANRKHKRVWFVALVPKPPAQPLGSAGEQGPSPE